MPAVAEGSRQLSDAARVAERDKLLALDSCLPGLTQRPGEDAALIVVPHTSRIATSLPRIG